MKETILDILSDIVDADNLDTCTTLIDDGVLSSLDIIQLIGALNDEFDISMPATEIIPQNFNSVDAMVAMVERLADELTETITRQLIAKIQTKRPGQILTGTNFLSSNTHISLKPHSLIVFSARSNAQVTPDIWCASALTVTLPSIS